MKTQTILIFLLIAFIQTGFAQKEKKSSAPEYLLAYNVAQDSEADDYEVYVMNLDGTGKKNITGHKDVAWTYYAWKNKIFFISDRDACKRCYFLYSMNADGTGVKKISDLQLEDSWMGSRNDGRELVVAGRIEKETRYQLFIINTETGEYRQITDEAGALHRDPIFSPDGRQIVFAYKKERANREEFEDLYIMDADGKNRRRLTTYPKDDKTATLYNYKAGPPRWNKKENFITYHSNQKGKSSLYAVTPDGKKHWKLTDNELNEGWHDWSPDGKWLAIEMSDKEKTEFGIYLMNYETKEIKKLTDPADFKFQQAPVFVVIDH